ncbi:Tol system periplasmic component [Rickettsia prowazekii str. GvF12]|nr:Tol system periplasmic component [Rickettsia prowazekii str. GvF12]
MVIIKNNKDNRIKNNQKNGDILVKTIGLDTTDNKALAFNTLENLITSSNTKIKEIAALEQVAVRMSEKKYLGAKNLLNKIIDNEKYSEISTAYARIAWCCIVLDDQSLNIQDKGKLQKYLNYFDDEKKPFWATATIIKAILDIKHNMKTQAEKNLKNLLASNNVSDLLKDQAKALLVSLSK